MIYSGSLERNFATKNIYIKNMTSWAKEAASLSGGKRAPHALERGPSLGQAASLLHTLEEGGRVKGWLVSVCIIFSMLQVFMALAKACEAAEVLKC